MSTGGVASSSTKKIMQGGVISKTLCSSLCRTVANRLAPCKLKCQTSYMLHFYSLK